MRRIVRGIGMLGVLCVSFGCVIALTGVLAFGQPAVPLLTMGDGVNQRPLTPPVSPVIRLALGVGMIEIGWLLQRICRYSP